MATAAGRSARPRRRDGDRAGCDHGLDRRLSTGSELRLGEIGRRLAQDLARLAQLPVLALQRLEPEHAVGLDIGAEVPCPDPGGADRGDTATLPDTLTAAETRLRALDEAPSAEAPFSSPVSARAAETRLRQRAGTPSQRARSRRLITNPGSCVDVPDYTLADSDGNNACRF